jgi:hypothetical protein
MLASILIIAFSLVLLVYWFRASCQLLLRNHVAEVASVAEGADSRFSYSQVQAGLALVQPWTDCKAFSIAIFRSSLICGKTTPIWNPPTLSKINC